MAIRHAVVAFSASIAIGFSSAPARATSFFFSTGSPDGLIGMATRPDTGSGERETGDDFILTQETSIHQVTFTGLVPDGATINAVRLEIYRVFPADSQDPPSGNVPTRVNSPGDIAFQEREGSDLSFLSAILNPSFTVANSVVDGISPNSGGDGPVSGQERLFIVALSNAFDLPADHYFFVPQVELSDGSFLWLSAAKPIAGAGTTPFMPDLQAWIRNDPGIAPDWLRVGTDIVGGATPPTFNAAFTLEGTVVPEPTTLLLLGVGLGGLALLGGRA